LFDHFPYSPDIAASDYHHFTYMKNWLGSQRFNNNEELMEGVKTWLSSQADISLTWEVPQFRWWIQFSHCLLS
jgi:hypothetical protein